MKILVTGGAGYIGSQTVRELLARGHDVVVLDNLARGNIEAVDPRARLFVDSIADAPLLEKLFRDHAIEAVMHFAGSIEAIESVSDPFTYYENNFVNSLVLLNSMVKAGIKKLVFSSTAAVYGRPEKTPIDEAMVRAPISSFGRSKMMMEMAIEDLCRSSGLGYSILRYFNVAGASPDGSFGEDRKNETHLVPRLLRAAVDPELEVRIFGTDYPTPDGTCIRDYVHVIDLARAHVLAIEALDPGKGTVYNVGSEKGFSVREIIEAGRRVTGRNIRVCEEGPREGDPAVLVASSSRIRSELNWAPLYPDIETILSHAWLWHSTHPNGYRTGR